MYNILVVDDDKEIVDSIEIYLKSEGFKIYKDKVPVLDITKKICEEFKIDPLRLISSNTNGYNDA